MRGRSSGRHEPLSNEASGLPAPWRGPAKAGPARTGKPRHLQIIPRRSLYRAIGAGGEQPAGQSLRLQPLPYLCECRLRQVKRVLRHEVVGRGCRGTPGRPGGAERIAGEDPGAGGFGRHLGWPGRWPMMAAARTTLLSSEPKDGRADWVYAWIIDLRMLMSCFFRVV